jgi:hypothetical protein
MGNSEPEILQINHDSSRTSVSFVERDCSQSTILLVCPGKIKSGAISLSGCNTNRRKCARGCGNVKVSVIRISCPKAIRSRSSGRGSLRTCLGRRPKSFSIARNFASRLSGVSPGPGTSATTAFTNGGEPGGQSTGEVCQREDFESGAVESCCTCSIAARRIPEESPRFEPSATNAFGTVDVTRLILFPGGRWRLLESAPTSYFSPNTSCMS